MKILCYNVISLEVEEMALFIPIWAIWLCVAVICFVIALVIYNSGIVETRMGRFLDPISAFFVGILTAAGIGSLATMILKLTKII